MRVLVDLFVDRILPSANGRTLEIIIFKQDNAYFGLRAPRGQFAVGQTVAVVMSKDGEQISWPTQPRVASPS